jgi:hypothetical protein
VRIACLTNDQNAIVLALRASGLTVWGVERLDDGQFIFCAELADRTGGFYEFTAEQVPRLLALVSGVRVTKDKAKSAQRMMDALDGLVRELHASQNKV